MNHYINVFKKYAVFAGRSSRSEYWLFALFNLIVIGVLMGMMIGTENELFFGLYGIYALASLIPAIAVSVRRLHDTGKSGAWILINFIPFGSLVFLIFMLQDSMPGTNQYGNNPKGVEAVYAAPTAQAVPATEN